MTLNDLEGHSPVAGLFNRRFVFVRQNDGALTERQQQRPVGVTYDGGVYSSVDLKAVIG